MFCGLDFLAARRVGVPASHRLPRRTAQESLRSCSQPGGRQRCTGAGSREQRPADPRCGRQLLPPGAGGPKSNPGGRQGRLLLQVSGEPVFCAWLLGLSVVFGVPGSSGGFSSLSTFPSSYKDTSPRIQVGTEAVEGNGTCKRGRRSCSSKMAVEPSRPSGARTVLLEDKPTKGRGSGVSPQPGGLVGH